jgi:hypothetical protein
MARAKKSTTISVLNWMGTLLLCAIPGVNIVAMICFMIFAKTQSKRNFALALLLLTVIVLLLAVVLLLVLPTQVAELQSFLYEFAATTPATVAP